ncbi:MAG TPA: DUF4142 domain-containing protein [Stellaceae bacterium]|nr:DUF4142 domain-containing protein [Stellaceae bacterium]
MRSAVRLGVTLSAFLVLVACSDNSPPPPVVAAPTPEAAAPPPPPPAPAVSGDQQFLDQAASGGTGEVELGKTARGKAHAKSVRAFAARMVTDHGRANTHLMALAKRLKMTPNVSPADTSQMDSLKGADFDKAYIADQVKAHEDTVALFEGEAKDGQDAQLRKFASSSLPMLRSHLKQAQAIAAKIGS